MSTSRTSKSEKKRIKEDVFQRDLLLSEESQIQIDINEFIHRKTNLAEEMNISDIVKFLNSDKGNFIAMKIFEHYRIELYLKYSEIKDEEDFEELYNEHILPSKLYYGFFSYYDPSNLNKYSHLKNGLISKLKKYDIKSRIDILKFERFKYSIYSYIIQILCKDELKPFDLKENDFMNYDELVNDTDLKKYDTIEKHNNDELKKFILEACPNDKNLRTTKISMSDTKPLLTKRHHGMEGKLDPELTHEIRKKTKIFRKSAKKADRLIRKMKPSLKRERISSLTTPFFIKYNKTAKSAPINIFKAGNKRITKRKF